MALYLFLPLSLLGFLFLHYLITPKIVKSEGSYRWVTRVGKPTAIAILKYVETFFLVATLTYAFLIVAVLLAGVTRATSSTGFQSALTRIQHYREVLKVFKSYWSLAIFVFMFAAIAVSLYRRVKAKVRLEIDKEKQRLKDESDKSGWDSLEPTAEMREIAKKIYTAQALFDNLDSVNLTQNEAMREAQKELKEKIRELRTTWHDLDLERRARINLGKSPERIHGHGAVSTFFVSKGILETVKGTSRLIGYAGLVLLFLSLVGVSVPLVDGALARRAIKITELQVKANEKEARESFTKLVAAESDEGTELKDDDEKALRDLSRHFEQAYTSSHIWSVPYVYDDAASKTRRGLIRDKIILVYRENPRGGPDSPPPGPNKPPDPGPSGPTKPPPKPPGSGPSSQPRPPSDDIRSRFGNDDWPQTAIGERFLDDVRSGIVRKPKLWGRIKTRLADYQHRFGEPIETLELGKWTVGEAMGTTIDSVWHNLSNVSAVNDFVKGSVKTGIKEAAKKVYESASNGEKLEDVAQRVYDLTFEQYVTDLSEGMPLEEALNRVKHGVEGHPVASMEDLLRLRVVSKELLSSKVFENLQKNLADNPPSLPESPRDAAEAKGAAERLEKTLNPKGQTTLDPKTFSSDYAATDTYEDHYPARVDRRGTTAREELQSKMNRLDPKVSGERFSQSRDLSQLRLSTDVGGVLIGRSPDDVARDVDFRDLNWTVKGEDVVIRLSQPDGSEITVGPFNKEIVNDALIYVADDRKVVVTIQTSFSDNEKLWRRRILLHPAFVDKPFGNDIIEFDELVFRFIKGEAESDAAEQRIAAQELLYMVAWRNRRLAVLQLLLDQQTDSSKSAPLKSAMAEDSEYLKTLLSCPKSAAALNLGLSDVQQTVGETSLLKKYAGHFDPQLVTLIADCGGRSEKMVENFSACVQAEVRDQATGGLSKEIVTKWLAQPVLTHPRSIAEERPFKVDSKLSFIAAQSAIEPLVDLWPFEFRYEIAFPALAPFLPQGGTQGAYREPWEYRELRTLIAEKVSRGVRSDAKVKEMFERVRNFTTVQRLFRISLEGGMGQQFPIEKLVDLTRATNSSNRAKETPRWEIRPRPGC